jgi:hypothetical protein
MMSGTSGRRSRGPPDFEFTGEFLNRYEILYST